MSNSESHLVMSLEKSGDVDTDTESDEEEDTEIIESRLIETPEALRDKRHLIFHQTSERTDGKIATIKGPREEWTPGT